MSRQETDREDLLREATALVERAELKVTGWDDPVVVGFRRDGSASVFFGADPVYQFNSANELRRAYVGGLLYKAEQGRLVQLRRERSEREINLIRHDLTDAEAAAVRATMCERLHQLQAALAEGKLQVVGQVPADGDVLARIRAWLAGLPAEIAVARAPHVR